MRARLYSIQKLVEELLYQFPDTRNSDALLYLMVCKAIKPNSDKLPLEKILLERENLGLPKYASVGRARRKLQEYNSELRATENVIDGRYEEYKEYKKYALEG